MPGSIDTLCEIDTNQSCGTHIHISPSENVPWDIDSLKSICRGIIHFEDVFEVLVPEHRRGNAYPKSFRADHPMFKGRSGHECVVMIKQTTHAVHVAELMNPDGDRNYTWNFRNLIHGGKMTIEFRRGPGVTTANDCLAWVELAVSFVRSARSHGTTQQLQKYERSVKGLKDFISAASVPGMSLPTLMTPIFAGKEGLLEPRAMSALTAAAREKLRKKNRESDLKNIMVKKIRMALE